MALESHMIETVNLILCPPFFRYVGTYNNLLFSVFFVSGVGDKVHRQASTAHLCHAYVVCSPKILYRVYPARSPSCCLFHSFIRLTSAAFTEQARRRKRKQQEQQRCSLQSCDLLFRAQRMATASTPRSDLLLNAGANYN